MPKTALFGVLMILLFSSSVIGEPMHDHDYIPSQEFDSKYQIQPPTCHISTAELLATARGTAQDLLRGVCDPKIYRKKRRIMPKKALFGVLMILLFSSSVIGEPMHDHDYIPSQEFDSKYQIQPPTCHISTAELLATARGTAQDLLRGVCDPILLQYKKQFRRVQATLMRRIPTATGSTSVGAAVSGTSLKPTDESFYGRHAMPRNLQPTSTSPPGSGPTTSGNQNKPEATSNKHFADLDETVVPGDDHHGILAGADQVFGTDTMQEVSDSFRLSYLDHGQDVGKFDAGSRQYEIDTYNATISELNGQRPTINYQQIHPEWDPSWANMFIPWEMRK
ncbi:unnamed protein product [Notodromas monacha]|uniref:Uncharacterized protein n=1 Tax=Notodromas monacha TaxID=399045 RepID=A0A7R9GH78_9CRUS|nr:unnamed protein product [Notodromas monacha]CAG0922491.1 unnamed protein product [Notodromas monacha]